MTSLHKFEHLLGEVRALKSPEDPERQFNLFRIIRSGHEEVSLHSRFLYELFDPHGSHQRGTAFLRLFRDRFNLSAIDPEKAKVFREKESVDISLLDATNSSAVIIENKIYAGDQWRQLERYHDKLSRQFNKVDILYLTLHGTEPSPESLGDLGSEVWEAVSYRAVIEWLEDCLKLARPHPTLHASILQYKFLLEDLTGGAMDNAEKQALHQLLDQDDHYDLALRLEKVLQSYREDTLETFWSTFMVDKVKDTLGDAWTVEMETAATEWRKFRVAKHAWSDRAAVCYEFGRKRGLVHPGIGVNISSPVAVAETATAYEKLRNDNPQLYPLSRPQWKSRDTNWLSYQGLGFTFNDPSYVAKCRPPNHEDLLQELSQRIVELARGVGPLVDAALN